MQNYFIQYKNTKTDYLEFLQKEENMTAEIYKGCALPPSYCTAPHIKTTFSSYNFSQNIPNLAAFDNTNFIALNPENFKKEIQTPILNDDFFLQLHDKFSHTLTRQEFQTIVRRNKEIPENYKAVFWRIEFLIRENMRFGEYSVLVGQEEIANRLKTSKETIKRASTTLQKAGYLLSKRGGKRQNRYFINYQYFMDIANRCRTVAEPLANRKYSAINDSPAIKTPSLKEDLNKIKYINNNNNTRSRYIDKSKNNAKIVNVTDKKSDLKIRDYLKPLLDRVPAKLNEAELINLAEQHFSTQVSFDACIQHYIRTQIDTNYQFFQDIKNPTGFFIHLLKKIKDKNHEFKFNQTGEWFRKAKYKKLFPELYDEPKEKPKEVEKPKPDPLQIRKAEENAHLKKVYATVKEIKKEPALYQELLLKACQNIASNWGKKENEVLALYESRLPEWIEAVYDQMFYLNDEKELENLDDYFDSHSETKGAQRSTI